MNKKIITIILALALPLTVAALPGDPGNAEGRHADRIERLTKNLDLTPEQKTKVEAIYQEQHDKFKAIHQETRSRIEAILTKEQLAKMDSMSKQHQEKSQMKNSTSPSAPSATDPGQKK